MKYIQEVHLFTFDDLSKSEQSRIINKELKDMRKKEGRCSHLGTFNAEQNYRKYVKENEPCPDVFELYLWHDPRIKKEILELCRNRYYDPALKPVYIEDENIGARLCFVCTHCAHEEEVIATERGYLPNHIFCWECRRKMEIKERK
jgi:hypothetical protein